MSESSGSALLTFLIADVRGYTRFTVEHGDEAAARLATIFAELTESVSEPGGGKVVELRGDEALVAFPSARDALRAAIQLQERFEAGSSTDLPLKVGIGIDAGEAIPVGEGYRGAALNLAARLCGLAGPGEVLASETVTKMAGKIDGLNVIARGATELKGFSSKVMVMQVLAEEPQPASPQPTLPPVKRKHLPIGGFLGALPANPIVAREPELERIGDMIAAVRSGEGRMVLLTGEPGVGKTRIAQEAMLKARNLDFTVVSGRCYEPEENVPYYPFREAIGMLYDAAPEAIRNEVPRSWPLLLKLLPRELAGPSDPGDDGQEQQQRLFYAVTAFLEALTAARPTAVLLDDLHWADGSSLKLLQHVARHTRNLPVLLLGTYRDVEVGRLHPLEGVLRDLNREGLTEEIAVRRLDRIGTAELTAATFGEDEVSDEFVELLHHHTEGNPFFTHEVLRALVERGDLYQENGGWERRSIEEIEVPKSVRSAVGERLSHLEQTAQELLAQASVLGCDFDFEELQGLSDLPEERMEEALEAAERAGLVRRQEGDRYAFNHALTQQVVYDEISPRRRRRLHIAAARAIERQDESKRRAEDLAFHYLKGDDPSKALEHSMVAGDNAESVFAHSEAERHYRSAVELAEELGDDHVKMAALFRLGWTLSYTGPFDEALELFKGADRIAVRLADREMQRRSVAESLKLLALRHLEDSEAAARYEELMRDLEPSEGLVGIYLALSRAAFGGGGYAESGELAAKAAEAARAIGSDYLLAEAKMRIGTAVAVTDIHDAIKVLDEAAALCERTANHFALSTALNNIAFQYMRLGDLEKNLQYRLRSFEVIQRQHSPFGMVWGRAMIAQAHLYLGNLSQALELGESAMGVARRLERVWHTSYACITLAHVKVLCAQWDDAAPLIDETFEIAREYGDTQGIEYGYAVQNELRLLRGEYEAILADNPGSGDRPSVGWGWTYVAEAFIAVGDLEEAARQAERMAAADPIILPEALRIRGMIAVHEGSWERARSLLSDALDVAMKYHYRVEEGRVLHEMGMLEAANGNGELAVEKLGEAAAVFRETGALAYARRSEGAIAEAAKQADGPR